MTPPWETAPLAIGEPAPEFSLPDQHGAEVSLSDYAGKSPVVVVFFPFAFTPTCTGELCTIEERRDDLQAHGAQMLGISCDPPAALRAFSDASSIGYPLLSDFWPHGAVSRAYGVFFEQRGFATRGTFVIDRDGILRWSVVNSPGEARNADDYARVLADL